MTTYFGFAIADGMLAHKDEATITKQALDADTAKALIESAVSCVNASHAATIDAMTQRYGINVEIPEKPPSIMLNSGDVLIVMEVRGLPRLTENRHYTTEEIEQATFKFSRYDVK